MLFYVIIIVFILSKGHIMKDSIEASPIPANIL